MGAVGGARGVRLSVRPLQEPPQHIRGTVHEKAVEINIARVRHDGLRAEVRRAGDRLLHEQAGERAFRLVLVRELVELGVSARCAERHGTVGVDRVDGHGIKATADTRQVLRLRAETQFQRVEPQGQRLVGEGRAVRKAVAVPICGKGEAHGRLSVRVRGRGRGIPRGSRSRR